MPQTHARLSASSAERFMECPGSVLLSELLPPDPESDFAAEGTAAHALGEICLRSGEDAWMHDGELMYTSEAGTEFRVDGEMARHVQTYLDFVRTQADGCELEVELALADAALGDDIGGRADAVIHRMKLDAKGDAHGFIQIVDLKYGAGIPVQVEGNAQLRYYAFLVLRRLGVGWEHSVNVGITVVQPPCPHPEGPIRTEWLGSREILQWAEEELLPAVEKVRQKIEEYRSGDHCRWCPAKLICPRLSEDFAALDATASSTSNAAQPPELSDSALADLYDKIKGVEMLIKAVKAEAMKRALQGAPIPGTKLIEGRSDRIWKDGAEEAIAEALGEEAYSDPKLLSPAQIEKLPGGKNLVATYAYKPQGKPSLVGVDARGVLWKGADGSAFESLTTEGN